MDLGGFGDKSEPRKWMENLQRARLSYLAWVIEAKGMENMNRPTMHQKHLRVGAFNGKEGDTMGKKSCKIWWKTQI